MARRGRFSGAAKMVEGGKNKGQIKMNERLAVIRLRGTPLS